MRLPRLSIADVMALTVLAALDSLIARAAWRTNNFVLLLFCGVVPWLNVLIVGLVVLWRRITRSERIAFLFGFEVAGSATLMLFVALIFGFRDASLEAFITATSPLNPLVDAAPPAGLVVAVGVVMIAMTIPHFIVALVFGFLNRRYCVEIKLRTPRGSES